MLKRLPKTIRLKEENIRFLEKFRKYKRETWDDLFSKLKEEFRAKKK